MKFLRGFTKKETSWMMYDWANSAHSVVVVTILPIFFNTVAGYMQDAASGMTVWGYATSAATLAANSSPFFTVPPRVMFAPAWSSARRSARVISRSNS